MAGATTTVQAIATKAGARQSAVATATYTFDAALRETVAAPVLSPGTTSFGAPLAVTLSTTIPGASIHYTLDGSTPSAASTLYEGPITVSATTTVQAMAIAPDLNDSEVAGATYTLAPVELSVDDGAPEDAIGVSTTAHPSGAAEFMWFNRFTPAAEQLPITLRAIRVLFPSRCHVGDRFELLVYSDADGDPTSGMTLETSFDATVQFNDDATWSVFSLPAALELANPGDVVVGVLNRWVEDGVTDASFPAAVDQTSSAGRSWAAAWSAAPADPPDFPGALFMNTLDGIGLPGNWMIRISN